MFGFRSRLHIPGAFRRTINPINKTMCWDQYCADGKKCCHTMDLGMSYCCTEYSGFMLLGLVLGGGLTIALLIVICYLCMRKAERRLEEDAKLQALKTLSGTVVARASGNSNDPSPSTPSTSRHYPPPAYEQVIAPDYLLNSLNHVRLCQTCDPHQVHTSCLDYHDITAIVARSICESNNITNSNNNRHYDPSPSDETPPQAKYYSLPPLPPVVESIDKLPTYNECTGHMSQNPYSCATTYSASSETSSDVVAMQDGEAIKIRNKTKRTSSLHRPIQIPIGHQHSTHNNGLPLAVRLSTPTQVDDGTGIIVAMQTGVRQTSIEENQQQESTQEASLHHQNTPSDVQEQVSITEVLSTPSQTYHENRVEQVANPVSATSALNNSLEEENNQISTSVTSESDSNDSNHEVTSIHDGDGNVATTEGNLSNEDDTNKSEESKGTNEEDEGSSSEQISE